MSELLFTYLATRPEYVRAQTCRSDLVGPMRQYLITHGSALNGTLPGAPPKALALIAARGDAEIVLADFCARCRRCKWGEIKPGDVRPVMANPLRARRETGRDADRDG